MSDDKRARREQVARQCEAVAHMAAALAELHRAKAAYHRSVHHAADSITDMVGAGTARLMETLGDILNGMDAVTEEDDWLDPIFHEAQRLWPTLPPPPLPTMTGDERQRVKEE